MRLPIKSIGAAVGALLALPGLAAAQTQITVGLPTSPPNVVHMPVIIAQELGLYKKYGIDVKTVSLPGGVHVFRAVLSGNADVGLSPASVTLVARSKGSPAKMLSANLQKFEASMVVRDNVKDMADLKGKRIGIQEPGGFADTISRGVLPVAMRCCRAGTSRQAGVPVGVVVIRSPAPVGFRRRWAGRRRQRWGRRRRCAQLRGRRGPSGWYRPRRGSRSRSAPTPCRPEPR